MTASLATLALYCVLIVGASLLGGRLPSLITLTHQRMQILISFVGGLMLGIGLFHMLPHAIVHLGVSELDRIMLCLMLGLLVMFFLLRTFHFHHHEPAPAHDHGHHHDHASHEPCSHHVEQAGSPPQPCSASMSWMGVFVGLSLHTLIDGLALGASVQADAMHATRTWTLGLGAFLAILLHKPLDALTITALMRSANWPTSWQNAVNVAFALMCPLGAALFVLGAGWLVDQQTLIVGAMLAFSAGVFLCISLSDLLPEMELHSHYRVQLSIALLLGISVAWGIRWLEPAQVHQPGATVQPTIDSTAWPASLEQDSPSEEHNPAAPDRQR